MTLWFLVVYQSSFPIGILVSAEINVREALNDKGLLLYEGIGSQRVGASWRKVPKINGQSHDIQRIFQTCVFLDVFDVLPRGPQEFHIVNLEMTWISD